MQQPSHPGYWPHRRQREAKRPSCPNHDRQRWEVLRAPCACDHGAVRDVNGPGQEHIDELEPWLYFQAHVAVQNHLALEARPPNLGDGGRRDDDGVLEPVKFVSPDWQAR